MTYRILAIDDERYCEFANVVARTYKAGIEAITKLGPWDKIYFDHDLGAVEKQCGTNGFELTGYDLMCFIEANPQYRPKQIGLLTANPSGRLKMVAAIQAMGYVSVSPNEWTLP